MKWGGIRDGMGSVDRNWRDSAEWVGCNGMGYDV